MAKFLPFHALMPAPEKVAAVAAVPYDVVNTEEAAALAEGNPLSFLRVSRPEIELAPGTDLYSDEVYAKAAANFKRLCKEAPLAEDPEANLYVYSLKMGEHTQVGIAGAASAADYDADIIKKHEKTRRDKEDDRARHVMELRNHSGPVFLTYRDSAEIDAVVNGIMKEKPYFSFTAPLPPPAPPRHAAPRIRNIPERKIIITSSRSRSPRPSSAFCLTTASSKT